MNEAYPNHYINLDNGNTANGAHVLCWPYEGTSNERVVFLTCNRTLPDVSPLNQIAEIYSYGWEML